MTTASSTAMPADSSGVNAIPEPAFDSIERALIWILHRLGKPISRAALRAKVARDAGAWTFEQALEALESLGLRCTVQRYTLKVEASAPGPLFLVDASGDARVITGEVRDGSPLIFDAARGEKPITARRSEPESWVGLRSIVVEPPLRTDAPADDTHQGRYGHWFWGPIGSAKGLYWQVGLAALFVNLFALVSSIFSMIVYDRVMPNNAVDTLTALVLGVAIVLLGDFAIRMLRAYFLDLAGARADMVIADSLYEQILEMDMKSRRGSTGATASLLREFESIRDFLTSATLTTLIDIPFSIIFFVVIAAVGGPIVLVPLVAAPIVVIAALLVQPRMKRLVQASQEDGHHKSAVLVETLHGIETVKSLGAGSLLRKRWQAAVSHQAAVSLKTKMLSSIVTHFSSIVSQLVWVGTVTYGFFLIRDGQIGSGAIVACSMLAGRAIAPLGQLAQLLTRVNQTMASYRGLNQLMKQPREYAQTSVAMSSTRRLAGAIELRDVYFAYPGQKQGAIAGVSLCIRSGERVALVGRVGSGKSTLLSLMMRLYQPDEGEILFDGIDSRQIEPAALRHDIGAVLQDIWLMSGSVRENIALGGDDPSDEEIIAAAQIAGVHEFVSQHPDGYAMMLRERGAGLSGGQRQAIAVARALVGDPPILLLDEPTSATDITSEQDLIERLNRIPRGRTVVLVTHRPSMLALVDRMIVVDRGKVIADGPKAEILARASQPGSASAGATVTNGPQAPAPHGGQRPAGAA
jgi:ATP-binding cassette subfamily C protein LapB